MGIKRYILLSVVYMLAVGLYIYSFNGADFKLTISSFSLELPIAIWVIVPTILLFVVSVSHLVYYSLKEYWKNRALTKDFDIFKTVVADKVLGKDSGISYKTEWFKFIGQSLKMMEYKTNDSYNTNNEKIENIRAIVKDLEDGKIVDLKKYKLSDDNALTIKNNFNKLEEDEKYASTILKNCEDDNSELCHKAYFKYLGYASFSDITKLKFTPTKEAFRVLMERYLNEEDNFDMEITSIEEYLMKIKATREDYLELAYEIRVKLTPDSLEALFEKLYNSEDHPEVADAYLKVLYDLQMIEKMEEILDSSEEKEYQQFKTLLFLREHGKNVDSGIFLRF